MKRLRQSAKDGLKVTVTVRPLGHRPGVAVGRAARVAGRAAGGVGPDDGLDLVVAGGRGVVVRLAADVGVGRVPALGLPVVDEVVGGDRRAVGPHRLRVDLVDDGLRGRCSSRSALSSSWLFMTGWSLLFTMKACGHTMFMISCEDELRSGRGVDVEPGQVLVERHGGRATGRRRLGRRAARRRCHGDDRHR